MTTENAINAIKNNYTTIAIVARAIKTLSNDGNNTLKIDGETILSAKDSEKMVDLSEMLFLAMKCLEEND